MHCNQPNIILASLCRHATCLTLQLRLHGNGGEEEAEGIEGADGPFGAEEGGQCQAGVVGFQVRESPPSSPFGEALPSCGKLVSHSVEFLSVIMF